MCGSVAFLLAAPLFVSPQQPFSSYVTDDEEEPGAGLKSTTHSVAGINGDSAVNGQGGAVGRYQPALESVGLAGRLKHLQNLPSARVVSNNEVFCNRELRLDGIRAIGFDMDYTLAQYRQPAFDQLAFDGAKVKLVEKLGYPKEVLDFEYDHTRWNRGLIIDTQRGNFIKIDRHKYVRVAQHGFHRMSSTTRKHLYSRTFNKVPSFSEKSFVKMDTLFQVVDAHLFALLVELKDQGEHEFLDAVTYGEMWRQIRECVDLCHRDGVIKDEVARDPKKYLVHDKGTIPMLKRYKEAGIKVFLVTNSYWEYTSVAMNYLYHGHKVDDELKNKNEWIDLFDLVVVGSCKPAFMLDPRLSLFRINTLDGSLKNTDGLFEIDAVGGSEAFLEQGRVYQGGNWKHLHALLEVDAGEEILYVGDHLYADVLRSKRTLGWRSAFIVPELEEEMRVFDENKNVLRKIIQLRKLRDELSIYADKVQVKGGEDMQRILDEIGDDDFVVKTKLSELASQWHAAFHPEWGAMFQAGYQDSRFAFYVQNYACLYTSRATNLGLAFQSRSFRTTSEMLPHDRLIADVTTEFEEFDPWE